MTKKFKGARIGVKPKQHGWNTLSSLHTLAFLLRKAKVRFYFTPKCHWLWIAWEDYDKAKIPIEMGAVVGK